MRTTLQTRERPRNRSCINGYLFTRTLTFLNQISTTPDSILVHAFQLSLVVDFPNSTSPSLSFTKPTHPTHCSHRNFIDPISDPINFLQHLPSQSLCHPH